MKKSRNLRRSKVAATEDEGQELGEAGTSPTRVAPEQVKLAQMQRLKQRKSEKKLSVLSFDDDGPEQDGPQRLKPLSTPVPLVMNPREAKAPSHTQMSAAGEYTAERIAELQRASKQLPKYAQVDSTMDNIDDSLVLLEEQGEEDGLFDEHEDSGLRARALRQRRKEAAHEPAMPMDGDLNVGKVE